MPNKKEIVYYAYKNENNEIICPFLEYMQKYNDPNDKNIKQASNIEAMIDHVAQRGGNYNLQNKTEEYAPDLGAIKIKAGKMLVRIAFITIVDEKMVLLDVMEKPSKYSGKNKLVIQKEIAQFIKKALKHREDYLKNEFFIAKNF